MVPPCKDLKAAPQSFWSSPGSGRGSHHAYPGGLATHMALNVAMVEHFIETWTDKSSIRQEAPLATAGGNHVLSIGESCETLVVGWIKAAGIIAGDDPVKYERLASDGRTLPRRTEDFVAHLADHDFVLSCLACQWMAAALAELAREQFGLTAEKDLNAFRSYALSLLTAIRLYGILSSRGKRAFAEKVKRLVA